MKNKSSVVVLAFLLTFFGVHRSTLAGVIVDPLGDATGIDLVKLEVSIGSSTVDVSLTFSDLIKPPSDNATNSVTGFIEFDLDLNPLTGSNPGLVDFFGSFIGQSATGLGVDGVILLASEIDHPGTVDIALASGLTGIGSLTTTSTRMTISFSRSLIGTSNELQFAAVVGDLNFVTDATSVGTASVSAVPEPSSFAMLGLASLSLLAYRPIRTNRNLSR